MIDVSVNVKEYQINKLNRYLDGIKRGVPKALKNGINETAKSAKNILVDVMNQESTISKAAIRSSLKTYKATQSRPSAEIVISGKRIALSKFGAKANPNTHDISYKITKTKGKQTIKYNKVTNRVFIQTMPSGHKGVFFSEYKSRTLKELRGPSLPRFFQKTNKINKEAKKHIKANLWKNILAAAKKLIAKGN